MVSKFTKFIMGLILMLLVTFMIIFGLLIYDEIIKTDKISMVKDFVSNITTISDNNTEQEALTPEILDTSKENTNTEETQFSNGKCSRYFYNQLNEYSKMIYNAIYNNKENMKSGTYQIEIGKKVANLASNEDTKDLIFEYYNDAISAYSNDNPDVFYIDFSKVYYNIETTTIGNKKSYKVFLNEGKGTTYLSDEFSTVSRVNSAINEVEQIKKQIVQNKKENDYQNVKMVHDYLIDNAEYDQTLAKPNIRNIYGTLIEKSCVCEGYAEAFKYLLDALDIPCVIVSGTATNSQGETENHAWNYVKLNGIWYAVDCTWDDPIIIGNGKINESIKYQYFLKGSKEFNTSHAISGQMSENGKNFEYPELSVENYK